MSSKIWSAIDADGRLCRARYSFPGGTSHTALLRLDQDAVLVFSPGAALAADAPIPDGAAVTLLIPSMGHTLGITAWTQRFPDAMWIAADDAREHAAQKSGREILPLSAADGLPSWLSLHVPPDCRLGEVWVRADLDGFVVWLVCDALMNVPTLSTSWWIRMFQRLYGIRTGPMIGPGFRRNIRDVAAFQAWAARRLEDADLVIPCHGDPLRRVDLSVLFGTIWQTTRP